MHSGTYTTEKQARSKPDLTFILLIGLPVSVQSIISMISVMKELLPGPNIESLTSFDGGYPSGVLELGWGQ